MGIQGLLPLLKSIMTPIHISDLRGKTVAVDTYSWLHKGALSCSEQLCKGLPTSKHIQYCMHRVNLLRHHGIKPILVFDGGILPIKSEQEEKRAKSRKENLERAVEHEGAGNSARAFECYQKALDISPSIASELIEVLKQENVDYIVAPYEADAQMTFLSINNMVDAVITEDSDLIPFGCYRIVFKMDKFGHGVEFESTKLAQNKDINLSGFTEQMLLEMCILSGCDYLASLPGMGVKRAHGLIQKLKSYDKVIKHLKYNSVSVPPQYEENFKKAILAFRHQRVYDPAKQNIVHLMDVPPLDEDLDFLGPWLPQGLAKGIAEGYVDPITKKPFEGKVTYNTSKVEKRNRVEATTAAIDQEKMFVSRRNHEKTSVGREAMLANGRRKLDLPVQRNVLTNYFCLASLEARRKFVAPKITSKQPLTTEVSPISPQDFDSGTFLSSGEAINSSMENTQASQCSSEQVGSEPSRGLTPSDLLDTDGKQHYLFTPVDGSCNSDSEKVMDDVSAKSCSPDLSPSNVDSPELFSVSAELPSNSPPALANDMDSIDGRSYVRSSYFKHKPFDANENRYPNDKENHCLASSSSPCALSSDVEGNNLKKRRLADEQALQNEMQQPKNSFQCSVRSTDDHDDYPSEYKANNKFGCNISYVNSYTNIAENSVEKFASLISGFRYSKSGSRASGLRAPLKDTTCSMRSNNVVPEISKFTYTGKRKSLQR